MTYYETEHFLPVGRLPWLCDIYIELALRDSFGLVLCFEVCDLICLHVSVLCGCPMSFEHFVILILYVAYSVSVVRFLSGFASLCGDFPLGVS